MIRLLKRAPRGFWPWALVPVTAAHWLLVLLVGHPKELAETSPGFWADVWTAGILAVWVPLTLGAVVVLGCDIRDEWRQRRQCRRAR